MMHMLSAAPDVEAPGRPAQLSLASLPLVPPSVRRPAFDPAALRPGILHLGCGAFHRAHQALLTQTAIEAEVGRAGGPLPAWGIVSASLCTPAVTRALAAQDGLYTVMERTGDDARLTVVGALRGWIFAPKQRQALCAAFVDPATKVVTMTVTSKGYCADARTGRLDLSDPSVLADLRRAPPATAIGVLVDGLRMRRDAGLAPPVVLSCDNLPSNGRMVRQLCMDFAAIEDDQLSRWIGDAVAFPSTMVDRIVPVCTQSDADDARVALGLVDEAPVPTEPYAQWVIERFDGPRPRWDAAGAEFVHDVAPWEASKLRLLNGGHLAIACLGLLAGSSTVANAMAVPGFSAFALRFMLDEQKPTLPPSDHDIDAYARQLLTRWRSRGIVHRLDRVARDASSKLPSRLLASLRDNRRAGRPAPCTVLAVAAWMQCVAGRDDAGGLISLPDALCAELRRSTAATAGDPAGLVELLMGRPEVFSDDLARDGGLRRTLVDAVAMLQQRGARGAVAACASGMLPARS